MHSYSELIGEIYSVHAIKTIVTKLKHWPAKPTSVPELRIFSNQTVCRVSMGNSSGY